MPSNDLLSRNSAWAQLVQYAVHHLGHVAQGLTFQWVATARLEQRFAAALKAKERASRSRSTCEWLCIGQLQWKLQKCRRKYAIMLAVTSATQVQF